MPSLNDNLQLRSIYASAKSLDIGVASFLFSFGRPVAFTSGSGNVYIRNDLVGYSYKHASVWREAGGFIALTPEAFDRRFAQALAACTSDLQHFLTSTPEHANA